MSISLRWSVLLPVGLGACNLLEPTYCTADVKPSIVVEVRDAATGAAAAAGALGYAEEGSFRAELSGADGGPDALELSGPFERAGTYRVTVQKEGYLAWAQEAVRVGRDECHVHTVRLRADLQSFLR